MAGELTREETEQFYDISADFDEYDPGLEAYSEVVRRSEAFLNRNGGYDSISYRGTLISLNDTWEYFDQLASVTGRVYVLEEGIVELAPGEWDGPHRDEKGSYFIVDNVELVSLGVLDVMGNRGWTTETDGESSERPVKLAFGFNPEDLESDEPMFYAVPDDILKVKYEMPTIEAIAGRLHKNYPEEMALIDTKIHKSMYDPAKLVKRLRKIIDNMQEQLADNAELQANLARYIHQAVELDSSWPYGVTVSGLVLYQETSQSDLEEVIFNQPSFQYLKTAGVAFHQSLDKTTPKSTPLVQLGLIFYTPSPITDGESIDGLINVPLGSINTIFSTRPMGSITESVTLAKDKRQRELYPEEADIVLPESVPEIYTHPKILEFRRLEALEELLKNMQKQTNALQRVRHDTEADALEVSSTLSKWFYESMEDLGLSKRDLIRVSGTGVVKANGLIRDVEKHVHIDVHEEHPVINASAAADIIGWYADVVIDVSKYEDDDGKEFWQIAPSVALTLSEESRAVVKQKYPLLSVAMKSSAVARLDSSTFFELPDLERMRRRNATMTALASSYPGSKQLRDARSVERAFYSEDPNAWTEARRILKVIKRIAGSTNEASSVESLEALRQQFLGRSIEIDADTWFADKRSDDHHNVGVVRDMFEATLPDGSQEIVINVAHGSGANDEEREQEAAALVVLRTASVLRF